MVSVIVNVHLTAYLGMLPKLPIRV